MAPRFQVSGADRGRRNRADVHQAARKGVRERHVRKRHGACVGESESVRECLTLSDQRFGRGLGEHHAGLEPDHCRVEVAPEVILAVVRAARVTAERVGVHLVAVAGGRRCVYANLDSRVFRPAEFELTQREAHRVDVFGNRRRRDSHRARVNADRPDDRAFQAGRVGGNLAARVFDSMPGADLDGCLDLVGGRAAGRKVGRVVELPGVTAVRARHRVRKAPGSVAAAIAVVK